MFTCSGLLVSNQMSGNIVKTGATAMNYETHTEFTLIIHAIDGGSYTGTATVYIQVCKTNF